MTGPGARRGPPGDTRFRKGESGNPKGRPRKAKPEPPAPSAFAVLVDKKLAVVRDGVEQQVSLEEALQHKTLREAIAGKRMAQRQVMKMIERREKARAKRHRPQHSVDVVKEPSSPHNADEALRILGIARLREGWRHDIVRLEPWAVQAAIDRMRGRSRLDSEAWSTIRFYTADSDKVRWPKEAGT